MADDHFRSTQRGLTLHWSETGHRAPAAIVASRGPGRCVQSLGARNPEGAASKTVAGKLVWMQGSELNALIFQVVPEPAQG